MKEEVFLEHPLSLIKYSMVAATESAHHLFTLPTVDCLMPAINFRHSYFIEATYSHAHLLGVV